MAYIPRLNDNNMRNNPWWYDWNIFWNTPNHQWGLPNCTCYALGRWGELWDAQNAQEMPVLCPYDARLWYGYTQDGFIRGQTPRLGAVICWDSTIGEQGHVAIVEEIYSDGSILTSNSAYNGTYFFTMNIPNTYYYNQYYDFQGFIYNPKTDGGGGDRKHKTLLYINKRKFMQRRNLLWR